MKQMIQQTNKKYRMNKPFVNIQPKEEISFYLINANSYMVKVRHY